MKKAMALLCVLGILLLSAAAFAAPGDAFLFSNDQRNELEITNYNRPSMAAIGDTVYTLWGSDVYTWQIGDDAPQLLSSALPFGYYQNYADAQAELGDDAQKFVSMLLSDGQSLYGLNTMNGYLFPLSFTDGQPTFGTPVMLDWTDLDASLSDGDYLEFINAYLDNGILYLLILSYDDYNNPMLLSYDLSSGKQTDWDVSHVQGITPYKDGKLLLDVYDYDTAYNEETGELANPLLSVLDPADGSVTELGSFSYNNVYGMQYNRDTDTLYYTTNSMLMAMPSLGAEVQAAFIPINYAGESTACLLPGGLYAILTWDGLFVRNTDPQYLPATSLSIYGGYIDDTSLAFIAQYPDIPLIFNNEDYYSSAAGLAQAMASGDSSNDIYNISLSYQDFTSLMAKGYCMNLSPYTALTQELEKLYPFLQTALKNKDGDFCGVPTNMYAYGLSTHTQVWEDAGLEDRIPTSFMGLIEFIEWWLDEGMEEHPDLLLMEDTYDYGGTLFNIAMDLYISQYQAEGKELTLDTPAFRDMMEALENLDIDALDDTAPVTQDELMYSDNYTDYSGVSLFFQYGGWLEVNNYNDHSTPLILSIEEGGARYIPVYVQCMFINPNTTNPDMAAAYLQNAVTAMDPAQHVMMFPDDNDPVPNAYYDQIVKDYETMLADAKASLETAAPENVKDIQSAIDNYEEFLSHKEDYYWQVSAESIVAYREMMPMCYTATPNLLNYSGNEEGSSEITTLIDRYLQKQITLDQFITQTDQKIRMIQLEMQ